MSVTELLRKVSPETRELSKSSQSAKIPDGRFRKLLKVQQIDERREDRTIFSFSKNEEEEEVEPKDEKGQACGAPCSSTLLSACEPTSATATQGVTALSAAMEAAFEKMASVMLVMNSSQEIETTFFLDNPQFASSVLFGTQITIREFSTAPKAFNIEILSNPQAIAAMQAGQAGLLAAFESSKFNFSVHRFETHIQQEERPVFHRKDDQDLQDQKGGRGQ